MVNEVINMIETNTSDEIDPELSFSQYVRRQHAGEGVDFLSAKQAVVDYAHDHQTDIPNYFESVIDICLDKHQTEEISQNNDAAPSPVFRGQGRPSFGDEAPNSANNFELQGSLNPTSLFRENSSYEAPYRDSKRVLSHVSNNAVEYMHSSALPSPSHPEQHSRQDYSKLSFGNAARPQFETS